MGIQIGMTLINEGTSEHKWEIIELWTEYMPGEGLNSWSNNVTKLIKLWPHEQQAWAVAVTEMTLAHNKNVLFSYNNNVS